MRTRTQKLMGLCLSKHVCNDALNWLYQHRYDDLNTLYNMCDRGDWIMWVLDNILRVDRKILILATCDCIDLVVGYIPQSYKQVLGIVQKTLKDSREFACGERVQSIRQEGCIVSDTFINYIINSTYNLACSTESRMYDISNSVHCVGNAARCVCKYEEVLLKCADIVRSYVPYTVFRDYLDSVYYEDNV